MKVNLIYAFLIFTQIYNAQIKEEFNFLADEVCECIENTTKVNVRRINRCQNKVFRKNEEKIEGLIKDLDTTSEYKKIRKHFAQFILAYGLKDSLFSKCKTYKRVMINEAYKSSKKQFINNAYANVCKEISNNKEEYQNIWDVFGYITEYMLENVEEFKEIARYYFYERERTDETIQKFQDIINTELKNKLYKKSKYYRQLMKDLKKK